MSNKVGRPTIMTTDILNKLEDAFALGCTDEEACTYANITSRTLYKYQIRNPEFVQRKEQLKQMPFLKARQAIISNLDDPEFALKYMERKKKDEFSLKTEHELSLKKDPRKAILAKYGLGDEDVGQAPDNASRPSEDTA